MQGRSPCVLRIEPVINRLGMRRLGKKEPALDEGSGEGEQGCERGEDGERAAGDAGQEQQGGQREAGGE